MLNEICKLKNNKKNSLRLSPRNQWPERFNGTLTMMLLMFVSGYQRDWDTFIPCILFAYSTTIHESTNESPI